MTNIDKALRVKRAGSSLLALVLLGGCVAPLVSKVTLSAPSTPVERIYVYPAEGQSPDQTERDRYERYLSAVNQTGIDPSRPRRPDELAFTPVRAANAQRAD